MDKKKYVVILLVIVCLLSISIGFAVVSQSLLITGSATTGDEEALSENFNVVFNNGTVKEKNDTTGAITGSVIGTTTEANITTSGMTVKDEYIVLAVNIKNNSTDYAARIQDIIVTNNGEQAKYFDVSYVLNSTIINPNDTTTLDVKITMLITPNTQRTAEFTISFVAEAVEVE